MAAKLGEIGDELDLNHDINVTPFIDVILVLLIIFMVAAPLATSDIPVKLPASTTQAQPPEDKPIYLSVQQDKSLFVGDVTVNLENLAAELDRQSQNNKETKIFIRGDTNVNYGAMMDLFNSLRAAGYFSIGLVGLEMSPSAPPAAQ
ncbi:TonB system transport protein ExbD [Bartonella sp. HY329]|uniref:TonB system transport protein ExbD n=1 Tax=unclassified Bartonella TaxID=2645622 RepID=UPI0021C68372|nr:MULTISPECIES: TonB system transport protein ExbD [unclassified Bartonella]UXM95577.1 TonB system transport protein ExbD [Bartonella sp. HY329]UXN09902.1 TonB system transport protein ExbD [Bartonella sp. HY328]